MLVGPSCNLLSTARPRASSRGTIILPSNAPSVSIFEATTILPPAAPTTVGRSATTAPSTNPRTRFMGLFCRAAECVSNTIQVTEIAPEIFHPPESHAQNPIPLSRHHFSHLLTIH